MDREISVTEKRKKRNKHLIRAGVVALALIAGFLVLRQTIQPSIDRGRIRTAVVERGALEATVRATGTVTPGFEQVISSPLDSTVQRVLVEAGSRVEKGQPLLELDLSSVELEIAQLEEKISLKRKESQAQHLRQEKERIDLNARKRVQKVERAGFAVKAERFQKLFDKGLVSSEELREAELQVERAAIEQERLEANLTNLTATLAAQQDSMASEIRLLEQELTLKRQILELGAVRADRDGILVGVIENEGVSVSRGQELARVADLSWFKVEASLSALMAGKLQPGQSVRLKVEKEILNGRVDAVRPTIEDGAAKVLISLEEAGHPGLKANLLVETFIVTDARGDVLKLENGPFLNGSGSQEIFVVRGRVAQKIPIVAGISNFEQVEIVQGLGQGDEVIISDMQRYLHLDKLVIQ